MYVSVYLLSQRNDEIHRADKVEETTAGENTPHIYKPHNRILLI